MSQPKIYFIARIFVIFAGMPMILNCLPAENPRNNVLMPLLLGLSTQPVPPDAVPVHLPDTLFPSTGPYALAKGEREALQLAIYERYNEGFYEPEMQPFFAERWLEVMKFAEEDGYDFEAMDDFYVSEVERVLKKLPVVMLKRIRYGVANSIIMATEMQAQPGFTNNGFSQDMLQRHIDKIQKLYRKISDEIASR